MAAIERWRIGREKLFEELTKVCDRIGADLASDSNKDKYLAFVEREVLRESRDGAARVDELKERISGLKRKQKEDALEQQQLNHLLRGENDQLQAMNETLQNESMQRQSLIDGLRREKLKRQRQDSQRNAGGGSSLDCDDQQPNLTPVPAEFRSSARKIELDDPNPVTRDTYRNLVVKYNTLYENWADLKAARNLLDESLREEKKKNRQYYSYVESQNKRMTKRDEKIQKQQEEIESLRARLKEAESRCDQMGDVNAATPPAPSPVLEQQHFHHSNSTEGDSELISINDTEDQNDTVKAEPTVDFSLLSDSPVVVSSRSVRRRQGRKDSTELSTVPRVKIEIVTSSPIGLAAFADLDTGESIDLDEIGEKVNTPKKCRRLLELSRRVMAGGSDAARREGDQGQDRRITSDTAVPESPSTPMRRVGPGRAGSALSSRSSNKQILPRTSEDRPTKKRRIATEKAIGDLVEDGEIIPPVAKGFKIRQAPEVDNLLHGLLAHPSPTKPILSNCLASTPRNPRARPRRPSPTSNLIHELNDFHRETDHQSQTYEGKRPGIPSLPSSSKGPIRGSAEPPGLSSLQSATAQFLEHGQLSATKRRQPRSNDESVESEIYDPEYDPDDEPFRARPVHKLGLEHFKVNPNYNQGYKYAFTDVVRNQAERRCLPGCTKSDCCGNKFRALAEITRDTGRPQTMSQEEEDQILLEEFLGDNKHKLNHMTVDARNEMLLQARTRHLANMHGRHRHAFERRKSPPGFWRADFPTTQEEMSDREKAAQVERELVAQRYEEAMRPGGAFMFRDE